MGHVRGRPSSESTIFKCIRYWGHHVSAASLNHGPKQTGECYKEKRSRNIPTGICNFSWISSLWRSLNISTAELSAGSHLRAWIPTLPAHISFRLIDLWWVKLNILIISWSRAVALHLSISIFLLYYFSSNKYLHCSMEEIDRPARWNKRRKSLHK